MFVARSVQGSGVRGGVGQLTRRWPTPDGHILRATTPEGVSPIIGPGTLPLQTPGATRNGDPWPAPEFTSQSPKKRSDQLATQPPPPRHGGWPPEGCGVCGVGCGVRVRVRYGVVCGGGVSDTVVMGAMFLRDAARMHLNRVAERPGVNSWRPRHSPALDD